MTTGPIIQPFFLQKGGEAGQLIRSANWQDTSLGHPAFWPPTLQHAIRFMLDSSLPMYIAWGPHHVMLYNDGYVPILGPARHPRMMGRSIKEISPEVWQNIESLYDNVWQGQQVMRHDYPISINKAGRIEQYYFDLNYTPLYLEDGTIGGLQAVLIETTDKLKAIQKLEEANTQLSFAIDAAELGTWDLNPKTNKFSGNARLKDWFGLEPDDDIPLALALAVIDDKDQQRVTDAIQQAMHPASDGRYDIEYTLIHPITDKPRSVRAKGRAWFNSLGEAYRFNGTLQDISEQAMARSKTEQSENYFRRLADAVPSIIWVTEPNGSCSYLNKGWYDYTGQTIVEAEGLGWLNATHPDDRQKAEETFLTANAAQKQFVLEYRLKSSSGNYRWAIDRGRPNFNANGGYEGMIGTVVDIHEQKMAQEALAKTTAHLQLATDSSQVGTWLLDIQKGTLEWSALHKELWGYSAQQEGLLYEDWWNVILPEDRAAALAEVEKAKVERLPYENIYRIRRANDGTIRWMKSFGRFFYDENGVASLVSGISMDITAQRTADAAIRESEERFRNLVQEATIATAVFEGHDFKLTLANEKMLHLWRKDQSIIGQRLLDFLPEMIDQPFPGLLRSVYLTGVTYSDTDAPVMLNRSGQLELVYMDFSYKALRNGDGDVYGILVAATDVTERYKFVKQLEESENRFRSLADAAPLAVFIAEQDAGITYANQELLRFVGATDLAAYAGRLWEMYAHPDDLKNAVEVYNEAWLNKKPYSIEMRMKQSTSGKYHWYLFKAVPRYEDGELKSYIGTGLNIQQQKELTQMLEEEVAQQTAALMEVNDELGERNTDLSRAQNFLTTVLDSLVEIVTAFDNNLVYTFVNEKAERMMGRSREEVIGEQVFDLHPNLQQDEVYGHMLQALKGEIVHIPQRRATVDTATVVETYIIPLFENKKVDGIVMLSRDITPMVKLTNELQRSNSDLQQFAHVASHDLKEPVRKIRTFGSKLQYEFADKLPETAQLYLSKMESAAGRMYSMIEGVLLYSSLGALEEAAEPVNLNDVLNDIETDLELFIQEKAATVQHYSLPTVKGSPVLLYQLFYNLINNALKFTKPDIPPVVSVYTDIRESEKRPDGVVRIVVEDNGIGFSEDKKEEIFGTFSRLHSKDKFEGTGLGLALCKKIAERHGGTIYADGSEGKGAQFYVELPIGR